MNDVKWIVMKVGMFDGVSFKKIKRARIDGVVDFRDKLTAVWFELLDLGGKVNNFGYLENEEIAFRNFEDIAIVTDRTEKEIAMCMEWYINNGMVEIVDDIFLISNWVKYQNIDGLEKLRQKRLQDAERQRKSREKRKQKQIEISSEIVSRDCHVTSHSPSISDSISNSKSLSNKQEKKPHYEDEELNTAFLDYIEFRKKIKSPMTDRAVTLAISNLNKLGKTNQERIEILNQSIMNGWKGLFDLQTQTKQYGNKQTKSVPEWYGGYENQLKGQAPKNQEMTPEEIVESQKLVDEIFGKKR